MWGWKKVVARKTMELESERHELEKALAELRITQTQLLPGAKMESIGQLAAGIAHEINTPTQYVSDNVGFVKSANATLLTLLDAALALAEAARGKLADEPAMAEFDATLKRTKLDFCAARSRARWTNHSKALGHIAGSSPP